LTSKVDITDMCNRKHHAEEPGGEWLREGGPQDLQWFRVEVSAVVEADKEKAEALEALLKQVSEARALEATRRQQITEATQEAQVCPDLVVRPDKSLVLHTSCRLQKFLVEIM
jgi:hypothetical protein